MRRIWLVLKNEFLSTVNKRSFWLTTILFPALVLGLTLGAQFLGWHAAAEADQLIPQAGTQAPLGYVDHSGIIERLPAEVGSGAVVAYADEEAAREAVIRGAVSRFAVIPSDYLSGGAVTITAEKFRPVDSFGFPAGTGVRLELIGGRRRQGAGSVRTLAHHGSPCQVPTPGRRTTSGRSWCPMRSS